MLLTCSKAGQLPDEQTGNEDSQDVAGQIQPGKRACGEQQLGELFGCQDYKYQQASQVERESPQPNCPIGHRKVKSQTEQAGDQEMPKLIPAREGLNGSQPARQLAAVSLEHQEEKSSGKRQHEKGSNPAA
jgi:hypothetical protein